MNANKPVSEAVGTFGLVFAGCAAIIVNDTFGGALGHVGVSLAFGLVVMAMIYSFGNVSGAHINPAVAIGFVVARSLSGFRSPMVIEARYSSATGSAGGGSRHVPLGVISNGSDPAVSDSIGVCPMAGKFWRRT